MILFSILVVAGQVSSLSPEIGPDGAKPATQVVRPVPVWAVRSIRKLTDVGLIPVFEPHRTGQAPEITRYELAVVTYVAYDQLQKYATDFAELPRGDGDSGPGTWTRYFDSTIRLAKEFRTELGHMGVSGKDFEKLLADLEKGNMLVQSVPHRLLPFTDVPKGHWAEKAAHDLKREGLLKGYPSGSFTGLPRT